jgi:hypothetical protein
VKLLHVCRLSIDGVLHMYTPGCRMLITCMPFTPRRPVKRAVQRELETVLAKALLRGDFVEEDTIVVEADDKVCGCVWRCWDRAIAHPSPAYTRLSKPVHQMQPAAKWLVSE